MAQCPTINRPLAASLVITQCIGWGRPVKPANRGGDVEEVWVVHTGFHVHENHRGDSLYLHGVSKNKWSRFFLWLHNQGASVTTSRWDKWRCNNWSFHQWSINTDNFYRHLIDKKLCYKHHWSWGFLGEPSDFRVAPIIQSSTHYRIYGKCSLTHFMWFLPFFWELKGACPTIFSYLSQPFALVQLRSISDYRAKHSRMYVCTGV